MNYEESFEPPARKRQEVRKKTKKWCKGKVGTPHKYVVHAVYGISFVNISKVVHYKCSQCGKEKYTRENPSD